jgi:hypothetical protein
VQALDIHGIGCGFHAQIQLAANNRGLALLSVDIRAGNFPYIMLRSRRIGDQRLVFQSTY